jgi:hypothetical protein
LVGVESATSNVQEANAIALSAVAFVVAGADLNRQPLGYAI